MHVSQGCSSRNIYSLCFCNPCLSIEKSRIITC